MRISGWFLGILSFFALVGLTAVCSVVTYGGVRGIVIDLWDSGVQVESPLEVVSALTDPEGLIASDAANINPTITPTRIPNNGVLVLPSVTPLPVRPTTDGTVADGIVPTQPMMQATSDTGIDQQAAIPTPTIQPTQPVQLASWSDPRQVRILMMGIDQRSATGETGPFRTDTMIVVNVDPVRKTAGMISFPRDLWVSIPNVGQERINTAHRTGDVIAYPGGGGPALAMETIAENFGIRIDYYVVINFDVFEVTVDLIAPSGIEICHDSHIIDPDYPDDYYGTIYVEFPPGCERMNGERLLQYARTRATEGADFDRARRQQQVLVALRDHLLSIGGVAQFVSQIGNLWTELSDSYNTNLSLDQIIRLGVLMGEIETINNAVVDNNYVDLGKSPTGEDVLIPYPGRISELVQRVFYPQIDVDAADLRTRAQAENATIRVYNGTTIVGLAGQTREWLLGRGVAVDEIGNAPDTVSQTVIKNYGNNRWTALYLAEVLGLPPERVQPGTDGLAANGIVIVLGPDAQAIISR